MNTPAFTEADIPDLMSRMTLEEKASLCSGQDAWHTQAIERLGIPAVMVTDGPHGLRKQKAAPELTGFHEAVRATCFPTASGLGSSWDTELMGAVGAAIARECRAEDVSVLLGPGINMKRSPLCGRNFEYFSEDPFLTGELAAAFVNGVQSEGVGTSLKHFAVNNQETDRLRVSADVDERALREIYLPAFEKVVKAADPWTIMCSYNRINSVFSSENPWLLTEVLREEWGYEGLVVSDWGAVNDRPAGVAAGLDLEMPGGAGVNDARVVDAVRSGALAESDLDVVVGRVLRLVARSLAAAATPATQVDLDANHALAREAARRTAVLLKNESVAGVPVLPLASGAAAPGEGGLVVIGEFARSPRYQGAGSSKVNPTRVDDALSALREYLGEVPFAAGFPVPQRLEKQVDPALVEQLRAQAVELAGGAHTAVVFLGLPAVWESEGYDRTHLDIPDYQVALLRAVRQVAARVVVVVSNGSSVALADWESDADAILECWLGGQASGSAVADLLVGASAPSGRLAESLPLRLGDVPAQLNFPGERGHTLYGESIFIGYRALDAMGREVSYPFGHGLTYTDFSFANLSVSVAPVREETPWEETVLSATFTVTNTGAREGVAVPQLYISRPSSEVARAPRELKAFARVSLEAGQSRTLTVGLTRRDLAHWDTGMHGWAVEAGPAVVSVGASSRDLPLAETVEVEAPEILAPLTLDSTVGEWMRVPEIADVLSQGAQRMGMSVDMQEDPATASFVLSLPIGRVTLILPFTPYEDFMALLAPYLAR